MSNPFEKPSKPSSERFEEKPEIPLEETPEAPALKKKVEEIPEAKEEEEFSPEIQKKAEEFDKELVEIIGKQLKSGEITSEQANEILEQAKKLDPKQKAETLEELDQEKKLSPEEKEKREKAKEEFQEAISQYEKAIDDLVERARALGIEVSAEQLRTYLENLRKIELESEEEMEWFKELNENIKNLSAQLDKLEKTKEKGGVKPEEEQKLKEDFSKIFEDLTAKIIKYVIKLLGRIAKGIIKGIMRAFR